MRHIKQFLLLAFLIFNFFGCTSKYNNSYFNNNSKIKEKAKDLSLKIQSISKSIDKRESEDVAFKAITYSKELANEYKVVGPALFHNTLINMNIKKRGLCYHYANDLLRYLNKNQYKSFKFIKAISKRDEYFEHTSIVLTTENTDFKNSIVLDAWRDTGELYFSKVKDDAKYEWEKK